jgi:hypothetical protein
VDARGFGAAALAMSPWVAIWMQVLAVFTPLLL